MFQDMALRWTILAAKIKSAEELDQTTKTDAASSRVDAKRKAL
jgi:hypothetical protein